MAAADVKTKATARVYRIVIIDDHPIVRRGLRDAIADEPTLAVAGEAASAADAFDLLRRTSPDLVIVDISLGDCGGLDLIRRIANEHSGMRILVLSMHDEEIYAERVLRAGAHGYVNKSESFDRLVGAIKKALQGETVLSPRMTERLVGRAVQSSAKLPTGVSALSDRELEVFVLIGQGLSTSRIADRLSRSIKTIETHRERIKGKLGVDDASELNRYAIAWVESSPRGSSPDARHAGT